MSRLPLLLAALGLLSVGPTGPLAAKDPWQPVPAQPAGPIDPTPRAKRHLPVGIDRNRTPLTAELRPRRQTVVPVPAQAARNHRQLKPGQPGAAPLPRQGG